jgi:hypothetical protein
VAGGGDANSMFRFRLERGDDGTKRCQKMKRRQRAHLGSMGRKRDTVWRRRPEERRHRGGERKETAPVGQTQILLDQKMKKIHALDSATTNGR